MSERHVCVWSGKRGGFGALAPTMTELSKRSGVKVSIVVTDQHLYERFGQTVREVQSRFEVAASIDMEQTGDSNRDRARAIGVCLTKAADVLGDLAPDVLLVIGDRGEVLAASIAAHNLRIALAHVQGGDVSGSLDEPVRHAVTKLAHVHLASTARSAERILRMGEEPWRVHVVGDTHVDQILNGYATPAGVLRQRYGLPEAEPFLIVLQHSDSTCPADSRAQIAETLAAVLSFNLRTMLVYPCSDQGFEGIVSEIEARRGCSNVSVHQNLPAQDFIGLQAIAGCIVGNSSCGLIEAPYFHLPAVNVGDRQVGRERAANVIDVPYDRRAIEAALRTSLFDAAFRDQVCRVQPPFGDGKAYVRIADIVESLVVDDRLLNKRMSY